MFSLELAADAADDAKDDVAMAVSAEKSYR